MSSRRRDPQDPYNPFFPDARIPQRPPSHRAAPAQQRSSPQGLLSRTRTDSLHRRSTTAQPPALDPSESFRKRSTTARLPAIELNESLRKRSTTARLPALDPSGNFRTGRTTLRLPAIDPADMPRSRLTMPRPRPAGQARPAEEHAPSETDLWLIAGSGRPGACSPKKQQMAFPFKMKVQLALLALALLLLLGAQSFIAHVAFDCMDAQAHRNRQECLALSIFPASSGSATDDSQAASTDDGATIPVIPDDLPGNVHDFVEIALPSAVKAHKQVGWPISVLLAQWGLEHGWHVPDAQGYNWGNTTYAPGCPYHDGSRFCYSDTPEEGLRVFLYGAQLSFYDGVREASTKGADAAAIALGESPWDAGHYGGADHPGSSLLSIMRNFNFYRFDVGG